MSERGKEPDAQARKAEAVRLIVTRRERAPRSPRMERALKRLMWRYMRPDEEEKDSSETVTDDEGRSPESFPSSQQPSEKETHVKE